MMAFRLASWVGVGTVGTIIRFLEGFELVVDASEFVLC